jgi:hypothetical protein
MKRVLYVAILIFSINIIYSCNQANNENTEDITVREVWNAQKANEWYAQQQWLRGSNFIPSTAINQLEMWQEDTFDPETIDRELGFAVGFAE